MLFRRPKVIKVGVTKLDEIGMGKTPRGTDEDARLFIPKF
jgi:hypothetical protein